jgi:hypothetical protein
MRLAEESFDLGFGAVENHGASVDTVAPLQGTGSLKFDCAAEEYGLLYCGGWPVDRFWVGLHFMLEDTFHRNGLVGWMTANYMGGYIVLENQRLVAHIPPFDVAIGNRIILPGVLYHLQLEIWFDPSHGSIKAKLNEGIRNDINYYPDNSGNVNRTPETYIEKIWLGSFFSHGQGNGWIDDVVLNHWWYLSTTDFTWPGRVTLRSSAPIGLGAYDEWSSAGLTDKWTETVWPPNALPHQTLGQLSFQGGADQIIDNVGNVETPPALDIYGPASNPSLENKTTSKTLQFSGDVPSGYYLNIQMGPGRTYLVKIADNSYEDWNGHISAPVEFWQLAVGMNTFRAEPNGAQVLAGWMPYYRGDWQSFVFDDAPAAPVGGSLEAMSHVFKCRLNAPPPPESFAKIIPGVRFFPDNYWGKYWQPQTEHIYPQTQLMAMPHRMRRNPIQGGLWDLADMPAMECLFKYSNLVNQQE